MATYLQHKFWLHAQHQQNVSIYLISDSPAAAVQTICQHRISIWIKLTQFLEYSCIIFTATTVVHRQQKQLSSVGNYLFSVCHAQKFQSRGGIALLERDEPPKLTALQFLSRDFETCLFKCNYSAKYANDKSDEVESSFTILRFQKITQTSAISSQLCEILLVSFSHFLKPVVSSSWRQRKERPTLPLHILFFFRDSHVVSTEKTMLNG